MTIVALVKTPLRSLDRAPTGTRLGETKGTINGIPFKVTLTICEIHIAWADRKGPSFVLEIDQLIKSAVNEIETLLGIEQRDAP